MREGWTCEEDEDDGAEEGEQRLAVVECVQRGREHDRGATEIRRKELCE